MNPEQQKAYEWAKNQNYQSVAAQYAKILADLISSLQADLARTKAERDALGKMVNRYAARAEQACSGCKQVEAYCESLQANLARTTAERDAAVAIVRCKDCKHLNHSVSGGIKVGQCDHGDFMSAGVTANHFCARGEWRGVQQAGEGEADESY